MREDREGKAVYLAGMEAMVHATLTISSKNYSSWSLRGWLLCRMAGLSFEEKLVDLDDDARQELLLLRPRCWCRA